MQLTAKSVEHRSDGDGEFSDFDCDFNPIHTRTMDRWISVAAAHSSGLTLPPVDLIQLGLEPVSDPLPALAVAKTPIMKLAKAHNIGTLKNFGLNKKKEVKNV